MTGEVDKFVFVKAMADAAHPACILETRKTAPGLRLVDKWAVFVDTLSRDSSVSLQLVSLSLLYIVMLLWNFLFNRY